MSSKSDSFMFVDALRGKMHNLLSLGEQWEKRGQDPNQVQLLVGCQQAFDKVNTQKTYFMGSSI